MPNAPKLNKELLKWADDPTLVTRPGRTKMYQDLKQHFWSIGKKRDIVDYVAWGLTCQSQNWAPKAKRIVTTIAYPSVEVGAYHHGLHCQVTTNKQAPWYYLGSYWLSNQSSPLFCPHGHFYCRTPSGFVNQRSGKTPWNSPHQHVRPWHQVCFQMLAWLSDSKRYQTLL